MAKTSSKKRKVIIESIGEAHITASSGGHPRSRNGIPAKGFKTRSKTKASNKYILERRKK